MINFKKINLYINSINTIEGLNSIYLKCRDCKKPINIFDSLKMSHTATHDPTSLVDLGILSPHEWLEGEQKNGKYLDTKRNWAEDHFCCRCEECNDPFIFCYKSWVKIHISNRRCRICRWKKWGGILLIIAFVGLIASCY